MWEDGEGNLTSYPIGPDRKTSPTIVSKSYSRFSKDDIHKPI